MSRAACSTMSLGETARRETSSGAANSRYSSLGMLSPADYETRLRPPDHTCEVSGERGKLMIEAIRRIGDMCEWIFLRVPGNRCRVFGR